jgi:hypothetical protein
MQRPVAAMIAASATIVGFLALVHDSGLCRYLAHTLHFDTARCEP